MSSSQQLAPFVASVLRDGTVQDLKREIEELRSQYQRLQLTGPGGQTVYCTRSFLDGGYSSAQQWKIDLAAAAGGNPVQITASDLAQVEVRLAGMLKAVLYQSCRDGYMQQCSYQDGFAKDVHFCCGTMAGCWLAMDVEMDPTTYSILTEKDEWGDSVIPSEELFSQLLAKCHPDAIVTFQSITFFPYKIEGAIKAWKIPTYQEYMANKAANDANTGEQMEIEV